MIAETLMHFCGWDAVWYCDVRSDGDPEELRQWWREIIPAKDGCLVGTWTGPDGDLLCVRECDTAQEAERWLAPPGRTILHAAVRSLWVRVTGQRLADGRSRSRRAWSA